MPLNEIFLVVPILPQRWVPTEWVSKMSTPCTATGCVTVWLDLQVWMRFGAL